MSDARPWYDRHGPLAFAIVGAVVLLSLAGILAAALTESGAPAVIVPAVTGALCGMHYGRERARQNRDAARARQAPGGA